jgi:hypothetical protein
MKQPAQQMYFTLHHLMGHLLAHVFRQKAFFLLEANTLISLGMAQKHLTA